MPEKYLPIGTVVTLKEATVKLMITGFCMINNENPDSGVYDYCGIPYPAGEISVDGKALFNHDQIDTINHMGMESEENTEYINTIKMIISGANPKQAESPVFPETLYEELL